jgi:hypothetical protein
MNRAALPLVDPVLRDDPMLYPDAATRLRLQTIRSRTHDENRVEERIWTRFQFEAAP